MNLTDTQVETITEALASALVCLAGDPQFFAEERQLRDALAIMGSTVVNSAGEPV